MAQQQVRDLYESLDTDATRLVFEDELTGVHNRRFFLSYLERGFAPVERGDDGAEPPVLGVVMVDIDEFKEVNDTYGHDAGDELIVWLASILREAAGESGFPVRWGGDEFVLLLPGADRRATREVADELWNRVRTESVEISTTGTILQLTLSIGVASAPEDARSKDGLSRAADAALYHSKRTGRDRVSSAHEVDPETIFPKAALYRLEASGVVARDAELDLVATTLDEVADGDSRMVVFEGEAGLGKTTLLTKIAESVSRHDAFRTIAVAGSAEEERRPLYLVERIVRNLRKEDEDETPAGEPEAPGSPTTATETAGPGAARIDRETLLRLAGSGPLVLLVDDLHLADEESMRLLGRIVEDDDAAVLICGAALLETAGDTAADGAATDGQRDPVSTATTPADRTPLQAFLELHGEIPGVTRRRLAPLQAEEIQEYLSGAFPGLDPSERIGTVLAEVTAGNPLFLTELVRMLVRDQKIRLVGQDWVVESLRDEDLPSTVDEIVSRQIETLDEEDRRLLEQLSALGESASFEALAGTSRVDEARLFEFLDRAEELGLLRLERERDDWNLRFLGKRIHEASYGTVDPERRRELHHRIADFHERYGDGDAGPAPGPVAHHYRRAGEPEKAAAYEELLRKRPHLIAPSVDEPWTEGVEAADLRPGEPLDDDTLEYVPTVLRGLIGSVRAIRLYPSGSRAITQARNEIGRGLDEILETTRRLKLSRSDGFVLVNDRRLAASECRALAGSYVELLTAAQLDSIAFDRGVSREELQVLLEALAELRSESIDQEYWRRFLRENDLEHIALAQQSYSRSRRGSRAPASRVEAEAASAGTPGTPGDADPQEQIPAVLRSLLGAVKSAELYPPGSDRMATAVADLEAALRDAVAVSPTLRIERIGDALSVNGVRLDASEFRALEDRFAAFLKEHDVDRITFSGSPTEEDLRTFLTALREQPNSGGDPDYWQRFTLESELSGLAVNDHRLSADEPRYRSGDRGYGRSVSGVPGGAPSRLRRPAPADVSPHPGRPRTSVAGEGGPVGSRFGGEPDPHDETVTRIGSKLGPQLVAEGERRLFNDLLGRLFTELDDQDAASRKRSAHRCVEALDELPLAEQYQVATSGKDVLTDAVARETDHEVLRELIPALRKCADVAIRFADYRTAGEIYGSLAERRRKSSDGADQDDDLVDELLTAAPEPKLAQLLESELRSRESERLPEVLGVLRSMGPVAVPLLVDVVEREDDLHVRQLAADVLSEASEVAAPRLKRALALAGRPERQVRILEVIDAVTVDLREELADLLVDRSRSVRRAAFELAERLDRPDLTDLLGPLMEGDDPRIARNAARALGRLGCVSATDALVRRLRSTGDTELITSCCQALGELGDPAAVDALRGLLRARRWGFFGRKWGGRVRAAAAKALRQISDRRAAEVLEEFADDRDPAVRQISSRGRERATTVRDRPEELRTESRRASTAA